MLHFLLDGPPGAKLTLAFSCMYEAACSSLVLLRVGTHAKSFRFLLFQERCDGPQWA